MDDKERLQLQQMVKANNVSDQTELIRELKHSAILKTEIQNLIMFNQSTMAPRRACSYTDPIPYNLTAHNSISIKCILIKNINRKTCTSPTIFDRTDITPSNKMNQLYHDYYYIHLDDKELEFIKKSCKNYTNIDVNYKSIDYYSQTNKIYNDSNNTYTLIDNLLIGATIYILYFAATGNFNGVVLFMTLSMFLITLNGVQNSLKNR